MNCEQCPTWDELMQKISALCKERDELKAKMNKIPVRSCYIDNPMSKRELLKMLRDADFTLCHKAAACIDELMFTIKEEQAKNEGLRRRIKELENGLC